MTEKYYSGNQERTIGHKLSPHAEFIKEAHAAQYAAESKNVMMDKTAVEVEMERLDTMLRRMEDIENRMHSKLGALMRYSVECLTGCDMKQPTASRDISPFVEEMIRKNDTLGQTMERINNLLDRLDF